MSTEIAKDPSIQIRTDSVDLNEKIVGIEHIAVSNISSINCRKKLLSILICIVSTSFFVKSTISLQALIIIESLYAFHAKHDTLIFIANPERSKDKKYLLELTFREFLSLNEKTTFSCNKPDLLIKLNKIQANNVFTNYHEWVGQSQPEYGTSWQRPLWYCGEEGSQ